MEFARCREAEAEHGDSPGLKADKRQKERDAARELLRRLEMPLTTKQPRPGRITNRPKSKSTTEPRLLPQYTVTELPLPEPRLRQRVVRGASAKPRMTPEEVLAAALEAAAAKGSGKAALALLAEDCQACFGVLGPSLPALKHEGGNCRLSSTHGQRILLARAA